MHKNATKCNETIGKWCKNKHGASKIIDTFETYHLPLDFKGASAFMFFSTNKGKLDTTLPYHLCILQSCNFLCFMLLVISMLALFHSLLDYEVALAAYFLL
jgi:hypothetical protein